MNTKQREIARRLKATYAALGLLITACLLWLPYFLWTGQYFEVQMLIIALAPYLVIAAIFWRGWHLLGRAVWLGWLTLFMLVAAFLPSGGEYAALYFFAILAFPFLLFSWNYERTAMIAATCLVSIAAVIAMAAGPLHLRDALGITLPPSMIAPAALKPELRSFLNQLTVATILLLELAYFAYLTQQANRDAAEALHRAQHSARAKGEFLANMSHEIRTPMNGLIGMLDVLENMGLDDRQAPVAGTMRNSALSLLRIINDILDASKIEAGKLEVDLHRTEFLPLIEGVAAMLRPLADEADVRVRLYIDPTLPAYITTDGGRIRQILLNLSSNAIKFSARRLTKRRGDVALRVSRCADGMVRFQVTDNGIGMDAEMQKALFQPFTQGDGVSKMQVSGTGLGLTITKNLIELLEGEITVNSTFGEGTDITVSLPLPAAPGDSRLHDISGTQILCMPFDDINVSAGLKDMLNRSGADVHFIHSVDEVRQGNYASNAVILLPTEQQDRAQKVQEELSALLPNCGIVRFSSERAARFGRIGPNSALVQIKPMLLSDMMKAIAETCRPNGDPLPTIFAQSTHWTSVDEPAPAAEIASDTAPRVLVVEDNEINRTVLGKQLDILGYAHNMASDGAEGLQLWQQEQFDIVLTDCHMPVMDGFELTRQIRHNEAAAKTPPIPIIAVTANALAGEEERCLNAGMDGYLSKPLKLDSLREKLEQML
ncbi:response regulator [Phaeobacter sp. CNT1-3]|nr:response regulator [Phaeobacter sp. CNT1-3]